MAGKRGNSEGSIRKRADGRWEARLILEDGSRRSLYGRTRQEAVRLLAEALREKERGITALGDRQMVEQFMTSWTELARHTIKPRTWRRYCEFVRLHIVPTLGTIPLTKLPPSRYNCSTRGNWKKGLRQPRCINSMLP